VFVTSKVKCLRKQKEVKVQSELNIFVENPESKPVASLPRSSKMLETKKQTENEENSLRYKGKYVTVPRGKV
jgi:hypothetical protein